MGLPPRAITFYLCAELGDAPGDLRLADLNPAFPRHEDAHAKILRYGIALATPRGSLRGLNENPCPISAPDDAHLEQTPFRTRVFRLEFSASESWTWGLEGFLGTHRGLKNACPPKSYPQICRGLEPHP